MSDSDDVEKKPKAKASRAKKKVAATAKEPVSESLPGETGEVAESTPVESKRVSAPSKPMADDLDTDELTFSRKPARKWARRFVFGLDGDVTLFVDKTPGAGKEIADADRRQTFRKPADVKKRRLGHDDVFSGFVDKADGPALSEIGRAHV